MISRLYSKSILILCFLVPFFISAQTTFTYTGDGNWSEESNWSPSYPGTTINSDDSVVIEGVVTFTEDVINNGNLTNNGTIMLSAIAPLTNTGTLINTVNATIIDGVGTIDNEGILINEGNIILVGFITNSGTITNSATISNSGLIFNYELGTFINTSSGILFNDESFSNLGSFTNEGRILDDGDFQNLGTIFGENINHEEDFNNVGILSPGNPIGTYTFGSDYAHESTARLDIQLESTLNFDRVVVAESANLNGTLDITLANGFVPEVNNSFTILTAETITGTFATVNLPEGYDWQITYTDTEVILEIPETLSISDSEQLTFSMYPNPASDQFHVQLNDPSAIEQLTIYNSLGQKVLTSKDLVVNTSQLNAGSYYVEAQTNQGNFSKKLIID